MSLLYVIEYFKPNGNINYWFEMNGINYIPYIAVSNIFTNLIPKICSFPRTLKLYENVIEIISAL